MLPKAPSFVVVKIAVNTDAARKQRTISVYLSRTDLLAARPFHWINTAAHSLLALWATPIWVNGSLATVSRSTGRIAPEACTIESNDGPSMPARHVVGSYVEPWLYRACIRAGGQPTGCSDDANAHP